MPSILNDVLIHGQDSAALEAAHTLVRTLISERQYSEAMGSMEALTEELDDVGFSGLWASSFHRGTTNTSNCFELTEKLIEVSNRNYASYSSHKVTNKNGLLADCYLSEIYTCYL